MSVTVTATQNAPAAQTTTTNTATASRLPDLPNEILLHIINNCSRETLKNVCLASRSMAYMAKPLLWHEIVLVPNAECLVAFEKAMRVSLTPRHVKQLTYDARFSTIFQAVKLMRTASGEECDEDEKSRTDALLAKAINGRLSPFDDPSIEVAMLTTALLQLPNLEVIKIQDLEDGSESGPESIPYFYIKMCRELKIDPKSVKIPRPTTNNSGKSYTKGALIAAYTARCRLKAVVADNVDGRHLFGAATVRSVSSAHQMHLFQGVLESLRELTLSFRNDTLMTTANHIESVQTLLKSAKRLKTLRLRMTDCSVTRYQYADDDLTSDITGLIETPTGSWTTRPLMACLDTLIIDACICHDEDLLHFLKIHSSTLRHLKLSNITLLGGDDRRQCWVRLIKHFKTQLKLSSVSFSGWLSNGGRQQWFVAKDSVSPDRIKSKVEDYVVNSTSRKCPLDCMAIKANQGDVEKPANGQEFEGDLTWAMVYPSRYGDQMDWQLTAPSFFGNGVNSSTSSTGESEVNENPHNPFSFSSDANVPLDHEFGADVPVLMEKGGQIPVLDPNFVFHKKKTPGLASSSSSASGSNASYAIAGSSSLSGSSYTNTLEVFDFDKFLCPGNNDPSVFIEEDDDDLDEDDDLLPEHV